MLKRLFEAALPLKEVSEQSAHEKSIRHEHNSTLPIWWARRPLAACRAAVFALLIPDPDDPDCPPQFCKLVMEVLSRGEFKPKNGDGSTVEDTPRNRCLEFIKHLVRWENSNNPGYIEPARKLIAAAHYFLNHKEHEAHKDNIMKSIFMTFMLFVIFVVRQRSSTRSLAVEPFRSKHCGWGTSPAPST